MLDRMLVDRLPAMAATATTPPEPTGLDHWYLVRLPKLGQTGWLIANMAYANIPLEVAMLAQGRPHRCVLPHRIRRGRRHRRSQDHMAMVPVQSGGREQVHDFERMIVLRWGLQKGSLRCDSAEFESHRLPAGRSNSELRVRAWCWSWRPYPAREERPDAQSKPCLYRQPGVPTGREARDWGIAARPAGGVRRALRVLPCAVTARP